MAFFNEFPHTRTYDSDLAWLIRRMKELMTKVDRVDELLRLVQELIDTLPDVIRERIQEIFNQLIETDYFKTLIEEFLRPYIDMRNSVWTSNNTYTDGNNNYAVTKLVCNVVGNMAMITVKAKWTASRTTATAVSLQECFSSLINANGVSFLDWITNKKEALTVDDAVRAVGQRCYLMSGSYGNYSNNEKHIVLAIFSLWQARNVSDHLQGGVLIPSTGASANIEYEYTVMLPII